MSKDRWRYNNNDVTCKTKYTPLKSVSMPLNIHNQLDWVLEEWLQWDRTSQQWQHLTRQCVVQVHGTAGKQLKITCPKQLSCGSSGAYWSDDHMPTVVGDTKSFAMYESYSSDGINNCKKRRFAATVTKCSSLHSDYVYRLDVEMSSRGDTFCGMN